jgi:hypothetical protein
MSDDVYITVSEAVLSVYATEDGFAVPLAAVRDSLDEARRRLR